MLSEKSLENYRHGRNSPSCFREETTSRTRAAEAKEDPTLSFVSAASPVSAGLPVPLQPPRDKRLSEVRVRATASDGKTGHSNRDLLLQHL